jgi:hypothetical protein
MSYVKLNIFPSPLTRMLRGSCKCVHTPPINRFLLIYCLFTALFLQLIRQLEPRNVLLVHGEKGKMEILKEVIEREFRLPVFHPPNGLSVHIPLLNYLPLSLSHGLTEKLDGERSKV